jgi:hypothetical protein
MKTTHDWLPFNHEALFNQANLTFNYLMLPPTATGWGLTSGAKYKARLFHNPQIMRINTNYAKVAT